MIVSLVSRFWGQKKKLSYFFLVFLFSKSAVFLAPLVLSNYLSLKTYGSLEYGISIGNILAVVLGMGLLSAYPYFILKKKNNNYFSAFLLFVLILFLAASILLFGLLLFYPNLNTPIVWAIIMSFIIASQTLFSSIYKTHNKSVIAVVIDGGFYIYLMVISGVIIFISLKGFEYLHYNLILYFFLFTGFMLLVLKNRIEISRNSFQNLLKILKYSLPLVLTSFLIMLLSNSGRLLVEEYFGSKDLAHYSFYFRIASGVVLFYQFASIVYFKQLFTASAEKLDKYFCIFFCLITTITIVGFFVVPHLFQDYFKLLKGIDEYREIYFLMVILVVYWIALALNEPLIYRENLAVKMNWFIFFILLVAATGIFLLFKSSKLSLEVIVKCHFIVLFFTVEAQFGLLRKHGIILNKTRLFLVSLFVLTFLCDFIFF